MYDTSLSITLFVCLTNDVMLLSSVSYCATAGDIFMIHTELAGQYTLRFAIGQSNTQMRHVQAAWQLIQSAADNVLSSSSGDSSQQQQPVVQQAANAGRSKQML